ncbi:DUF1919 domain-containing protein [Vagococcus fluvialis]|uniref:DUF1919 domain-containing protein n=1 Tax=Vagococcus fluvialis TaxID=2738 RepID=UPI0032E3A654
MKILNNLKKIYKRKRLKKKNFTIISDNCWGNFMYQSVGIEYQSPFIGMFIYAEDYIRLLDNLDYYLKQEIVFIKHSKWEKQMPNRSIIGTYPIGVIGSDVEIHFLHYNDEEEVVSKWKRRLERMDMNNLYIKMSEKALCEKEHILKFDKLNFKNKVCFTKNEYPELKSCIFLEKTASEKFIQDEWKFQSKKFKFIKWINEG